MQLASRLAVPKRSISPRASSSAHCPTASTGAAGASPPTPNAAKYSSILRAVPHGSTLFTRPEKTNTAPRRMRHTPATAANPLFRSAAMLQNVFYLFPYPPEHALRRTHPAPLVGTVHHRERIVPGRRVEIHLPHAPLENERCLMDIVSAGEVCAVATAAVRGKAALGKPERHVEKYRNIRPRNAVIHVFEVE